jgi:hypothetical protein
MFLLRAVCEHGYTLAQSLDPNSEGRGVLQFKTGLMSVIRVCPFQLHILRDFIL